MFSLKECFGGIVVLTTDWRSAHFYLRTKRAKKNRIVDTFEDRVGYLSL